MKQTFVIWVLLIFALKGLAQTKTVIDEQILTNGALIRLTSVYSNDENKHYAIEIINRHNHDTIVNFIDSLEHAHCSPPNSIFFINDSIGFFTESGGCYASYDWLFSTTNKGKTWKYIETASRTFGNPAYCRLNNTTFYMFSELKGIIIWDFKDNRLSYSLTMDGGKEWKMSFQELNIKAKINEIQNITFSADGQAIIVLGEKYSIESDRKRVKVIESIDFGNSFHTLN
ncbi:MAG TPA: hypothetical protein PK323_07400 [Bacteroidia bacterium]|nr:hypothetical protein [Bacteroidia bacterium]